MKAGNRHILLFVDNAPSHPLIELSNITLKFFPPNMTAAAEPLDQGIIQRFKLRYRRSLMDKLLVNAEHCKSATDFTTSITVLDAIRWIRSAWDSVEFSTITKCFHRCGFSISELTVEGETPNPTVASLEDIKMPETTEFLDTYQESILNVGLIDGLINKFINFDNDIVVHNFLGDDPDSILHSILFPSNESESSDSENESIDQFRFYLQFLPILKL